MLLRMVVTLLRILVFGTLLRSEVLDQVESALHGATSVSSVEVPGNILKICFVNFDSP